MSKAIRVLLSEQASEDILAMIGDCRGEFVEITPSKMASWVISHYRKNAFEKGKKAAIEAHYNHRKALAHALKAARSEEELRAICTRAMKRVGRKQRPKKQV